jgi:hypothetical protein
MVHEYRGVALESFAVAFTADGRKTLVVGPDDHITVLDSGTGKELQKLTKDPEVIQQIFSFGSEGQAAILHVDGDGRKPRRQTLGQQSPGEGSGYLGLRVAPVRP